MGAMLRYSIRNAALEDFEERFAAIREERTSFHAFVWYWTQISLMFPGFCRDSIDWGFAMFKNYFKMAIRTLFKNKLNSLLNVIGLAVSMACCLLIVFHVKDELSYESGFPKFDRIYRIRIDSKYGDTYKYWAVGPPMMGALMKEEIPEIEAVCRFRDADRRVISYRPDRGMEKRFEERGGYFTDSSVISMFDLELHEGDAGTALQKIESVLISESMARRYFGTEPAAGKVLYLDDLNLPMTVTAVFKDLPRNTHFRFTYLLPYQTFLNALPEGARNSRTWKAVYTYLLLDRASDESVLSEKISAFRVRYHSEMPDRMETYRIQAIEDIHLHSKLEQDMGPNSDIAYVYIFSISALFILIIAAVNFINIATAQSLKRLREVGIRKVVGAQRTQLMKQFLGESILLTSVAGLCALLLFYLSLPMYNTLSGKALVFTQVFETQNLIAIIFFLLFIGITAGLYPSFFASSFRPVNTLSGARGPKSSVSILRKGLVIFQFVISVFMIFCTITIYRQLVYFREADLGFDKKSILAVEMYGEMRRNILQNTTAVKAELLRNPMISHVALTSNIPGQRFSVEHLRPEGVDPDADIPTVRVIRVNEDFIKTLNITLSQGKNFIERTGDVRQVMLNEMAVEALNIDNPVGKRAQGYFGEAEIVGVIADFHFASLHNVIEPLVLEYRPNWSGYLLVKYEGETPEVLEYVEKTISEIAPNHLFDYTFVDEYLGRLYNYEDRVSVLFQLFSLLAILISCLGLFGLSVFSAELRIKEIGVRKVMGASESGIMFMLSKNYLVWICIANLIAWPIGYMAMNRWLTNFAFRIQVNVWTFLVSALIALFISLLTVTYQSIRAALADPVKSLRYE